MAVDRQQTQSSSSILGAGIELLNRIVSPETRKQAYAAAITYANRSPFLFAFLSLQVALGLTPVLLFMSFVFSTVLFAVTVALLFTVFWTSVALLVLVPILGTSICLGVGLWTFFSSSYILSRWAWELLRGSSNTSRTNEVSSTDKITAGSN